MSHFWAFWGHELDVIYPELVEGLEPVQTKSVRGKYILISLELGALWSYKFLRFYPG